MDPEVLAEAKDFVSSGIEKFAGGASGLDTMVSFDFSNKTYSLASMQIRKRINGPLVWSCMALCDGRRFLVRSDKTGKVYLIYVLRWQVGRFAFQVLISETLC